MPGKKENPVTSDALRKAITKYNKKSTVAFTFRLNKNTEADLIEYVESLDNKAGTIKRLLLDEMKKNKE